MTTPGAEARAGEEDQKGEGEGKAVQKLPSLQSLAYFLPTHEEQQEATKTWHTVTNPETSLLQIQLYIVYCFYI